MEQKHIFFIVGHHGAGKSYLCKMIKNQIPGVCHLECGETIRSYYNSVGSDLDFYEWEKMNRVKYDSLFSEQVIFNELMKVISIDTNSKIFLIAGHRSISGIEIFCSGLGIKQPSIVFIDNDFTKRKRNYEARENVNMSDAEFRDLLNRDVALGLDLLKQYVQDNPESCGIINNSNITKEAFLEEALKVMKIDNLY